MTAAVLIPHSPEWYADRRDSIGASDAPVIVGVAPRSWGHPVEMLMKLYAEKVGLIDTETLQAADTPEQQMRKRVGLLAEDMIATLYTETTGYRLQKVNTRPRHRKHDWMRCSLDRVTVGVKPKRIVQLKQRRVMSDEWGNPDDPTVPMDILVQEQHELAVTGAEVADVAVLFGGNDPRIYTVERDDELIADLIELEAEFMACVRDGRTPDYAGLADRGRRVRPPVVGEIEADESLDALIQSTHAAIETRKAAEIAEKALKERLADRVDPYAVVHGSTLDLVYRPNKPSTKTAWELVAKAYRAAIEHEHDLLDSGDMSETALPSRDALDAIESTFTSEQAGARPIRITERKAEAA